MRPFYARAEGISRDLTKNLETIEKDFALLVEGYGEDPKGITPEEFFGIFSQFLENWAVNFFFFFHFIELFTLFIYLLII